MKKIVCLLILLALLLLSPAVQAGMESTSYRLTASVLSGGGNLSESTTYKLYSTIGQPSPLMDPTAPPGSTNYDLYPGFWYTLETGPICANLAAFAAAFGTIDGDIDYNLSCDLDNDGDVDGADLSDLTAGL